MIGQQLLVTELMTFIKHRINYYLNPVQNGFNLFSTYLPPLYQTLYRAIGGMMISTYQPVFWEKETLIFRVS